jgi:hypothetical protein
VGVRDRPSELGQEEGGDGRVEVCAVEEGEHARIAYNTAAC